MVLGAHMPGEVCIYGKGKEKVNSDKTSLHVGNYGKGGVKQKQTLTNMLHTPNHEIF